VPKSFVLAAALVPAAGEHSQIEIHLAASAIAGGLRYLLKEIL